jgi:thymidylate kinase
MKIIALEGPDGVGKSYQTDAVAHALEASGITTVAWHHPLCPPGRTGFRAALWYADVRAEMVQDTYAEVVIADRWFDSTEVAARDPFVPGSTIPMHHVVLAERAALPRASVILLDASLDVLRRRLIARGETPPVRLAGDLDHYRMLARLSQWSIVSTDCDRAETTRALVGLILGML